MNREDKRDNQKAGAESEPLSNEELDDRYEPVPGELAEQAEGHVEDFVASGEQMTSEIAENLGEEPDETLREKLASLAQRAEEAMDQMLETIGLGDPKKIAHRLSVSGEKPDYKQVKMFVDAIAKDPSSAGEFLSLIDGNALTPETHDKLIDTLVDHNLPQVRHHFDGLALTSDQQERFFKRVVDMDQGDPLASGMREFCASKLRLDHVFVGRTALQSELKAALCFDNEKGEWIGEKGDFLNPVVFEHASDEARQSMLEKLMALSPDELREAVYDDRGRDVKMSAQQKEMLATSAFEHGLPGLILMLGTNADFDRETRINALNELAAVAEEDAPINSLYIYESSVRPASITLEDEVQIALSHGNPLVLKTSALRTKEHIKAFAIAFCESKPEALAIPEVGPPLLENVQKMIQFRELSAGDTADIVLKLKDHADVEGAEWLDRDKFRDSRAWMLTREPFYLATFSGERADEFAQRLLEQDEVTLVYEMHTFDAVDLNPETRQRYALTAAEYGNVKEVQRIIDPDFLELLDPELRNQIKDLLIGRIDTHTELIGILVEKNAFQGPNFELSKDDVQQIVETVKVHVDPTTSDGVYAFTQLLKYHADFIDQVGVQALADSLTQKAGTEVLLGYGGLFDQAGVKIDYNALIDSALEKGRFQQIMFHREHFEAEGVRPDLFEAYARIEQSPSASLQKVKDSVIAAIHRTEKPLETVEEIEAIFVRNNLPEFGKHLKVFEIIYLRDQSTLDRRLDDGPVVSLEDVSTRGMRMVAYRELTRVNIESNNDSLRTYLESIRDARDVIQKFEQVGLEGMNEEEQKRFSRFCEKMSTAHEVSMLGKIDEEPFTMNEEGLATTFKQLLESMQVKEGQSLVDRYEEMFAKPVGYESVDQVLDRMDQVKAGANERGRALAEEIRSGEFTPQSGDQFKGVNEQFFRNVLRGGSVSMEFLGASSENDMTPFNTDFVEVRSDLREAEEWVQGYGPVYFYSRDRGQFIRTSDDGEQMPLFGREARKREGKYELLVSDQLTSLRRDGSMVPTKGTERHTGVTVGLPSSEFDAVVLGDEFDQSHLQSLQIDVATNGWYMPIINLDGELLFTPEQYDQMREKFLAGIESLNGPEFDLARAEADEFHNNAVEELLRAKQEDKEATRVACETVRALVADTFTSLGIEWRVDHEATIAGAELHETGSSTRFTNRPKDYDFDFAIRLDPADYARRDELLDAFIVKLEALGGTDNGSHDIQLRFGDISVPGLDIPVGIDIAFVQKSEHEEYSSHFGVQDRLNVIREKYGEEAFERTVTNVVFAKMTLTEAGCYKKGDYGQGGLGGIGVENWILSNGGDFLTAAQSFVETAFSNGEDLMPFSEFRAAYPIIDPGIDLKSGTHDNFIDNMTGEGYEKMANALKEYIAEHAI